MGEILTRHGEKGELAKLFNTSRVTVRKALRGKSNSELAEKIRKAAKERGGKEE
jgi:DNA-binding FadR family transcriptional regulator